MCHKSSGSNRFSDQFHGIQKTNRRCFIDFAKAFDTVPHKRLIYKLEAYGITGPLLQWISSFLRDRLQKVVLGDFESVWKAIWSGVPQGSVLGPLLFLIYLNDISDTIVYSCKQYADDTKSVADAPERGKMQNNAHR